MKKKQVPEENKQNVDYKDKTPEKEEFTYHVKKCGGSSHIGLGKRWLDRYVKVNIEAIEDE